MTDESLNLLPCPWCNGEARIVESVDTGEKYGGPHFIVRCPSIVGDFVTGCLGNHTNLWDMTPEDAANRWNRRTPQPDKAGVGGDSVRPKGFRLACVVFGTELFEALSADGYGITSNGSFRPATSAFIRKAVADYFATPPPPGAGEDRRDAERYRWLRSQVRWELPNQRDSWTTPSGVYLVATMVSAVYGNCDEQTDTAIDAAMRGEGNG